MATINLKGDAPAVAQVDTLTAGGTVETDDLFKSTIANKVLSVPAGTATATAAAAAFVAAWNLLSSTTYPEFAEATAAVVSAGALSLTADTAGVPFTETASTTEANGSVADAQTFGQAATTVSSGPNHYDTAANWSAGAIPVNNDVVWLENRDVDLKYGLGQSAVTLTSMNVPMSYTGDLGLPNWNDGGYAEYRKTYLETGITTLNVGMGEGTGSGRLKFSVGSAQCLVNVYNTGSPTETPVPAMLWKGTHVSNVANNYGGSLGIAYFAGETATLATLRSTGGSTVCGEGTTHGDIDIAGGSVAIASAAVNIAITDGSLLITGSGGYASLVAKGGSVDYRSSGTIAVLENGSGGSVDFSKDPRPRVVTECNLYAGFNINDPDGTVTWGNINFIGCGYEDGTLVLGKNISITVTRL